MAYNGLQFDEVKQLISKYCSFTLGRETVLKLMPIRNELALKRENARMREAIHMTYGYGGMPFGSIYDISNEVSLAIKGGTLNPEELLKIAAQSYGIDAVFAYMKNCECEKAQISDICRSLTSYKETAQRISKCISPSFELYDNASSKLSGIRRTIRALNKNIASKMAQFIAANASCLQEDIVATRNGRSVVLVKNNFKNTVMGLQYGSSASSSSVYIEPACMVEMNNDLQSAQEDEKNEIQRILHELSQLVGNDGEGYIANTQTLALLDSLFARARWAKENNAVMGRESEKDFCIEKGRHPLIDPAKVVANSYHMINPIKTILITGANTGGKTVSLKIIGLFSLLFLCGIPLTCEDAQIPFFDRICYDIGDNQSIDDDLSTFGSHIRNIAGICSKATRRSLVILDELGSSTDPIEGQALACAVLDYLREKGVYTVATTHFSKLKSFVKQYDDVMVSSVEFDQMTLTPTYRYLENSIGQSNAIEIARRYDLNENIVEHALMLKKEQQSESDVVLEKVQQEYLKLSQNNERVETLLKQLKEKEERLESESAKLQQQKESVLAKARNEATEILLETQMQADELIEKIKSHDSYNIKDMAQIKHELHTLIKEEQPEGTDADDENFKIGDYVRITLTGQCGEITDIKKKEASIDCGGIKIRSSLANLKKTVRKKEKKSESGVRIIKHSSFSSEINLIGLTVAEALAQLDKYFDTAIINKAPFVRVIHGVGSGALRTAIWDMLKHNKYVARYEMAPANQGGTGATIVTFRE